MRGVAWGAYDNPRWCGVHVVLLAQAEVFAELQSGVDGVLRGINCTIFAYGQTGTGKTHTMLGASMEAEMAKRTVSSRVTPSWGVIPRAVAHLFR